MGFAELLGFGFEEGGCVCFVEEECDEGDDCRLCRCVSRSRVGKVGCEESDDGRDLHNTRGCGIPNAIRCSVRYILRLWDQ